MQFSGSRRGFTLIELLVVIAVIAVLMGILMPALSRAREQGKRAACLSNCKQLTLAWTLYADDNDDKLVNGDTGEYSIHNNETPWVLRDWESAMTRLTKENAIRQGALFPYTGTLKIYKCQTVGHDVGQRTASAILRTYSISEAMNCKDWPAMQAEIIKRRAKIDEPAFRIVFVDEAARRRRPWAVGPSTQTRRNGGTPRRSATATAPTSRSRTAIASIANGPTLGRSSSASGSRRPHSRRTSPETRICTGRPGSCGARKPRD